VVILRKAVPELSETALSRFAARACRILRLRGAVNVLVTSSREMRSLNRRFRGKDHPTDVLSFPPMPELADQLAGDLAISAEIAGQSAHQLGHSPGEEVKILVLHGLLHLAGYDHQADNGSMARKEAKLRSQLGLPVGLIERSQGGASLSGRGRRSMRKR
jgi:probable rRNA maturation factor